MKFKNNPGIDSSFEAFSFSFIATSFVCNHYITNDLFTKTPDGTSNIRTTTITVITVSRVSVVVSRFSGSLATGESPDSLSNERFAAAGVDAISHCRGGVSFRGGFFISGPLAQVSLVVGEKVGSFEFGKAFGSGKSIFEAGSYRGGGCFFISGSLATTPDLVSNERFATLGVDSVSHGGFFSGFLFGRPLADTLGASLSV